MKFIAIIPVKNNYDTILQVIEDLKANVPNVDYLIVDYGSTDNTNYLLQNNALSHIKFPIEATYDKAMQLGLKFAETRNYDGVIEWSALGKFKAVDLIYSTRVFEHQNVDMVLGTRYMNNKPSFWNFKRRHLSRAIKFATGDRITDPVVDFKIVGKRVIKRLGQFTYTYSGPDTTSHLLKVGMTYKEIEISVDNKISWKEKKGFIYTIRNILFIILINPLNKKGTKHA